MNKQKGFVQGALLIGIALLAIVIGAFAMASNNNTSDVSKEKIKTNAAVTVKKMADAFEQFQITAAQEDLSAANTKMTNLVMALPTGFKKTNFTAGYMEIAVGTFNGEDFTPDATACAQINKILGIADGASLDGLAEKCDAGRYTRVFTENSKG